jgi:hypothetical protein
MAGAGRTISVRMPEGSVEELRAATGLAFGTLVRFTMLAYLERLRRERRLKEGETFVSVQDKAATDIREIVDATDLEALERDNEHDGNRG